MSGTNTSTLETVLVLQGQEILWRRVRFIEIGVRSIAFLLEDQTRFRFEFASPELLDEALAEGFQIN